MLPSGREIFQPKIALASGNGERLYLAFNVLAQSCITPVVNVYQWIIAAAHDTCIVPYMLAQHALAGMTACHNF